jgi:hypothetical protein
LTIGIVSVLVAFSVSAQTVYKSVDSQGRVTYSSSPPPEAATEMVEAVPLAPGPTPEQQQEAAKRARDLEAITRAEDAQRQAQTKKGTTAATEARQELRDAQIALQEARIQGDDDWQYLAAGGRVLKQSYLDRVDAAEKRVKQAEKALRSARSGRR